MAHGQRCPTDEQERNYFGCGTTAGNWWLTCWAKDCGDECAICGGEGVIIRTTCPMEGIAREEVEMFDAWTFLAKHSIWPASGGLDNQSALFIDAVRILDDEQQRHEEIERSKRKQG